MRSHLHLGIITNFCTVESGHVNLSSEMGEVSKTVGLIGGDGYLCGWVPRTTSLTNGEFFHVRKMENCSIGIHKEKGEVNIHTSDCIALNFELGRVG